MAKKKVGLSKEETQGQPKFGCGTDQVECRICKEVRAIEGDTVCFDCRLNLLLERRDWHQEMVEWLTEEIDKCLAKPPAKVVSIGGD